MRKSENRTALIDGDVLVYEVCYGAEYGKEQIPSFEYVRKTLDNKISEILSVTKSDNYQLYLTGSGNFRENVAKKKVYKGNRQDSKPWHYENIRGYMIHILKAEVIDGMEADDMLAIVQTDALSCGRETIICTRDKDLLQVKGWHYGWESGKQGERSPHYVEDFGQLSIQHFPDSIPRKPSKLSGEGVVFFWAQVLTGDVVDNYPGLPRCGPVKAYDALKDARSYSECRDIVTSMYEDIYAERALEELTEQAQLAWMVRSVDSKGNPVMWDYIGGECEEEEGSEDS